MEPIFPWLSISIIYVYKNKRFFTMAEPVNDLNWIISTDRSCSVQSSAPKLIDRYERRQRTFDFESNPWRTWKMVHLSGHAKSWAAGSNRQSGSGSISVVGGDLVVTMNSQTGQKQNDSDHNCVGPCEDSINCLHTALLVVLLGPNSNDIL